MRDRHEVIMKDDTRIALLEQSIGHVNESLIRIEKRFDRVETKIDTLDNKINDASKTSWSQFRWIIGIVIALTGTVITALIKGHIA
jgi:uncharacterized coiled-coil protein SlyX